MASFFWERRFRLLLFCVIMDSSSSEEQPAITESFTPAAQRQDMQAYLDARATCQWSMSVKAKTTSGHYRDDWHAGLPSSRKKLALNITRCVVPIPEETTRAWSIMRLGPFRSWPGGSSEFAYFAGLQSSELRDALGVTHSFARYSVRARLLAPVDRDTGDIIGHPPLHIHHSHLYPDWKINSADNIHVLFGQSHGDSQCRAIEGGVDCLLQQFPEPMGINHVQLRTVALDGVLDDVRSTPTKSALVAMGCKNVKGDEEYPRLTEICPQLRDKHVLTFWYETALLVDVLPAAVPVGMISLANPRDDMGPEVYHVASAKRSLTWWSFGLRWWGRLLHVYPHTHQDFAESWHVYVATPEELGLNQGDLVLERPWIALDDSALVVQAATMLRNHSSKLLCKVARKRVDVVDGREFGRRTRMACRLPWDFSPGTVITVAQFNYPPAIGKKGSSGGMYRRLAKWPPKTSGLYLSRKFKPQHLILRGLWMRREPEPGKSAVVPWKLKDMSHYIYGAPDPSWQIVDASYSLRSKHGAPGPTVWLKGITGSPVSPSVTGAGHLDYVRALVLDGAIQEAWDHLSSAGCSIEQIMTRRPSSCDSRDMVLQSDGVQALVYEMGIQPDDVEVLSSGFHANVSVSLDSIERFRSLVEACALSEECAACRGSCAENACSGGNATDCMACVFESCSVNQLRCRECFVSLLRPSTADYGCAYAMKLPKVPFSSTVARDSADDVKDRMEQTPGFFTKGVPVEGTFDDKATTEPPSAVLNDVVNGRGSIISTSLNSIAQVTRARSLWIIAFCVLLIFAVALLTTVGNFFRRREPVALEEGTETCGNGLLKRFLGLGSVLTRWLDPTDVPDLGRFQCGQENL